MLTGKSDRVLFINTEHEVLMLTQISTSDKKHTYINIHRLSDDRNKWIFVRQLTIYSVYKKTHPKVITVIGWALFFGKNLNDITGKRSYTELEREYFDYLRSGIIEDNTWHLREWNKNPTKKKA